MTTYLLLPNDVLSCPVCRFKKICSICPDLYDFFCAAKLPIIFSLTKKNPSHSSPILSVIQNNSPTKNKFLSVHISIFSFFS